MPSTSTSNFHLQSYSSLKTIPHIISPYQNITVTRAYHHHASLNPQDLRPWTAIRVHLTQYWQTNLSNTPCKDLECRDTFETAYWSAIAHTEAPPFAFDRRASGGGRPKKPDENSPNAPQANPNDPNSPSGAGDQQGESGGFSDSQETSGGFSNPQETEGGLDNNGGDTADPGSNAQPAVPKPALNAPAANNPGQQNAVQYPPSARNSRNQPAASANSPFNPRAAFVPVIDVAARSAQFRQIITRDGLTGRPWFFYSSLDRSENKAFKQSLEVKLGEASMPYMSNVLPVDKVGETRVDYQKYTASQIPRNEEYYWAANSKAYAQAVEGRIYVAIPGGSSANQPYANQGSNWWTFEIPELTRNARVDSITVVPIKEDSEYLYIEKHEGFYYGAERVIWRRGDEPIGFPANELHDIKRPDEPWETVPEVVIPK